MATQIKADPTAEASRLLLDDLTRSYTPCDFNVRFWDGSTWEHPQSNGSSPRFTLVLKQPGATRHMFWPFTDFGIGEAYLYDDFDIEGDVIAFVRFLRHLIAADWTLGEKARLFWRLLNLPKKEKPRLGWQASTVDGSSHSKEKDIQSISYHYDRPPEVFQAFLDPYVQYSCAYFKTPDDDLDTAQVQKLDLVCRKLRLKPGETLLDVGFGWGGLILYAAKHYGVNCYGISISKAQVEFARERIKEEGLQDRCKVEFRDYRDLGTEQYDKAATISVAEHIGEKMQPLFLKKIYDAVKPGGVYLHHGINLKNYMPYPRWTKFARKYVFPNGEVRPLETSLRAGELAGFEIRDVENMREHYALTIRHWIKRLEERHDEIVKITDEVTYRIFRIYLAGSHEGMRLGNYQLNQVLFSKPAEEGNAQLPLTRDDWYK
ncbi:MAG: class I SAM-dependent methyltransferase [Gemmataceae bacterium]